MIRVKNIIIGSLSTGAMLSLLTWNWRIGAAFVLLFIATSLFRRLWIISVALYLSSWGYFWVQYGAEVLKLFQREDSIMIVLNLIPVTILVLLLAGVMVAGFPIPQGRSNSVSVRETPEIEVLGPEPEARPLKVELTVIT